MDSQEWHLSHSTSSIGYSSADTAHLEFSQTLASGSATLVSTSSCTMPCTWKGSAEPKCRIRPGHLTGTRIVKKSHIAKETRRHQLENDHLVRESRFGYPVYPLCDSSVYAIHAKCQAFCLLYTEVSLCGGNLLLFPLLLELYLRTDCLFSLSPA